MGHVVQLEVHQSQIEQSRPSAAVTRFVEQQADCLSGVWAHAATSRLGLDPAQFRSVALRVLTSISTDREIASHGTPQQRIAAIDRGLHGTGPQACSLATFH
jgi:predicted metalloprotease